MKKKLLSLSVAVLLGVSIANAQYTKTFTGTTVDTSFAKQYLDAPGQFAPTILQNLGEWTYSQANNILYVTSAGNSEWEFPCFVIPGHVTMAAGDSIIIVARCGATSPQDSVKITLNGLNNTMVAGANSATLLLIATNQNWQTIKVAYTGDLYKIELGENLGWYSGPRATPPWWTWPYRAFDGTVEIQSVTVEGTHVSGINNLNVADNSNMINNYPNPAKDFTKIQYSVVDNGMVSIKVYDVLGKEVTTLVSENKVKGAYEVNYNISSLLNGIYFYTMSVNNKLIATQKMIVTK